MPLPLATFSSYSRENVDGTADGDPHGMSPPDDADNAAGTALDTQTAEATATRPTSWRSSTR